MSEDTGVLLHKLIQFLLFSEPKRIQFQELGGSPGQTTFEKQFLNKMRNEDKWGK